MLTCQYWSVLVKDQEQMCSRPWSSIVVMQHPYAVEGLGWWGLEVGVSRVHGVMWQV